MKVESVLGSLSLFMFAGFAIGLVIGDPTGMSAPLSMIALGTIMTLSMSDMVIELGKTGSSFIEGLVPALMTFGILTPVFIAASFFFDGHPADDARNLRDDLGDLPIILEIQPQGCV